MDDEPLIPELIKEMLEEEKEFEVSQITTTQEDFLKQVSRNSFEVALIDISIGKKEGGMDILQVLSKQKVQLPIIVLSGHSEIDYGLKCLQLGAKGYINKLEICSSLTKALKEVCCGNLFVSGAKGTDILNEYANMYPLL